MLSRRQNAIIMRFKRTIIVVMKSASSHFNHAADKTQHMRCGDYEQHNKKMRNQGLSYIPLLEKTNNQHFGYATKTKRFD